MSILYIILSVLFILVCGGLVVCILLQKKSSQGLGSIAGMGNSADTYWDRNRNRSLEGTLEKYTKIGGVVLFIFSLAMCVVK
ncbi:MAG: preprotein translocase subunit SecG [Clostridiales bacterium]|jgi:preprotein translocase subunit SecG|nr:preprotein translocase subunit SecG [Clostridiales bacterium]